MVSVLSLSCPVCGAPFAPGAGRCGYCGSILVLRTDHPRIDSRSLNRAVVDEHIADFRELLRTDPNAVKAHYGLGVAYFNLGLTEAAIDALEKAASLTPENPHIHTQLAVAWREDAKTGDSMAIEEMRDHIRYALRLDPDNVEALILASEEASRDHDIEQAVTYSERAWNAEPDRARELHDRMLRSWIAWKLQRQDMTDDDLRRIESFFPDLADTVRERQHSASPDTVTQANTPAATPAPHPMLRMPVDPNPSPLRAALSGLIRAVLITIGLFFAGVFATAISSSLSTAFAYIVLVSLALWLLMPIIYARRAATVHRKKDQR